MHSTGVSNVDYRVTEVRKQQRAQRLPLHETRIKYHDTKLGVTLDLSPPVDLARATAARTQEGFYKTAGKAVRSHPDLTRLQVSPLKGKEYFVGGDNEPYLYLAHKELKPESCPVTANATPQLKSKYHKTKETENKQAPQETQLVHIAHTPTLEGQVDLVKVADIRRTLRRRYANRQNIRQIFNQWDTQGLGVLRVEDVHSMVNRLGIPINHNEARVLVASTNPTSEVLGMEEFIQLVYEDSDRMNVDLTALKTHEQAEAAVASTKVLALNEKVRRLQDQLKVVVKERITDLVGQMVRSDKTRSGVVSFEAFCEALNNMGLPHTLSNEKQWSLLYSQAGGNTEGLNYREFQQHMEGFVPEADAIDRLQASMVPPRNPLIVSGHSAFEAQRKSLPSILDPQRVPVNRLGTILERSRRIRQLLRDKFSSETAFREFLTASAQNGAVSQSALKGVIESQLGTDASLRLTRAEVDSFLSSFHYNPQGDTGLETVVTQVFSDDMAADRELSRVTRAFPPVRDPLGTAPPRSELKPLLQQIDEKVFTQGVQTAYKAFKLFDADNDGYLTMADLRKGLTGVNVVHNETEVGELMRLMDKSGKGYCTFDEFAKVVKPNTYYENSEKLQYPNYVQPSKEFLETQLKRTGRVNEAYEELRTRYKPEETWFTVSGATRFGSKPAHKDTFGSFAPGPEAGMFLDDQTRFHKKNHNPINIGNDDKAAKYALQQAKTNRIRNTQANFFQRVSERDEAAAARDLLKVGFQAATKEEYERRCHLYSAP